MAKNRVKGLYAPFIRVKGTRKWERLTEASRAELVTVVSDEGECTEAEAEVSRSYTAYSLPDASRIYKDMLLHSAGNGGEVEMQLRRVNLPPRKRKAQAQTEVLSVEGEDEIVTAKLELRAQIEDTTGKLRQVAEAYSLSTFSGIFRD